VHTNEPKPTHDQTLDTPPLKGTPREQAIFKSMVAANRRDQPPAKPATHAHDDPKDTEC